MVYDVYYIKYKLKTIGIKVIKNLCYKHIGNKIVFLIIRCNNV